jgi:transcriptional regulator with XRE-family HTH domain
METIGKRLQAARKRAGYRTQLEAAAVLGVDNSSLSKVEGGKDQPGTDMLLRAAAAYNVPLGEILPPDHPLASAEVVLAQEERAWLRLFRSMTPDQRRAMLALLRV